jgi:hypothetical protein
MPDLYSTFVLSTYMSIILYREVKCEAFSLINALKKILPSGMRLKRGDLFQVLATSVISQDAARRGESGRENPFLREQSPISILTP